MSLKEKIMASMMDRQFKGMSVEEKRQMMDSMMERFFGNMSDDEKKTMMSDMMPRMMGSMMGGSSSGNPMMGMMSMMMGKMQNQKCGDGEQVKMPWDMCSEMMAGLKETANTARFATPELRGLFDEWCLQVEREMLDFLKESTSPDIEVLSGRFSLSTESIRYLLARMANKGMVHYTL